MVVLPKIVPPFLSDSVPLLIVRSMTPSNPTLANVRAIADLERQALQQRSHLQRFTDAVTDLAGSAKFLVAHALWFGAWVVFNRGPHAFDPFPFSLLNALVSLEALFLTSCRSMSLWNRNSPPSCTCGMRCVRRRGRR